MKTPSSLRRIYVVSGAGSGIGAVTSELLEKAGHRVVGVDIKNAAVLADLSTSEGRREAAAEILMLTGGNVDAVILCAGLRDARPETVSVNFFGSVELLEGLGWALSRSASPRAVFISSVASVLEVDDAILAACLQREEARARDAARRSSPAEDGRSLVYSSTKAAVSKWIRETAGGPDWGGRGILLNAVAPGTVVTPMMDDVTADPATTRVWLDRLPNTQDRFLQPVEIAHLAIWLASPENTALVGQTLFADLGCELLLRGSQTW